MALSAYNLFNTREELTHSDFMIVTIEICGSKAMASEHQQGIRYGQ
jgi:hypothetical protein